ncbi:hypothetical protein HCA58_21820 [Micromonospora sp. HNM0581]|uniref:SRPBCC domain-containing protein n=1 Tax=Micromonospora sp. HNM0581 TaxID=2716341 RepID=UPI00146EA1A7|nr:SRPBCC domain-containing protein [Micromonospora sp. HNM0581]NLU80942.1 hypothetical protein [Micromonospora sp. HNM0581]
MTDTATWLKTIHREVDAEDTDAGRSRTVKLSRTFAAPVDDIWDAITNPERLARWFYPISGDLRVGGKYALDGNASGEIMKCDKPSALSLTWEYGGGGSSDLDITLRPSAGGGTVVDLQHTAILPFDDETWAAGIGQFAPGWDHGFSRLDDYLKGELAEDDSPNELSPAAQELWAQAGAQWSEAVRIWRS